MKVIRTNDIKKSKLEEFEEIFSDCAESMGRIIPQARENFELLYPLILQICEGEKPQEEYWDTLKRETSLSDKTINVLKKLGSGVELTVEDRKILNNLE